MLSHCLSISYQGINWIHHLCLHLRTKEGHKIGLKASALVLHAFDPVKEAQLINETNTLC